MNMLMMMLRMMLPFSSFRRLQARKEGRMSHTAHHVQCVVCWYVVWTKQKQVREQGARQGHAASHIIIIGILYASLSVYITHHFIYTYSTMKYYQTGIESSTCTLGAIFGWGKVRHETSSALVFIIKPKI